LTEALPNDITIKIKSEGDAQSHIIDIVNIVSSEAYAYWELDGGLFPILVVVKNAIEFLGGGPKAEDLKKIMISLKAKFEPSAAISSPRVLKTIPFYREVIDNLLESLLKESWLDFKRDSELIKAVDKQLRDIITNMEKLKKEGKEKNVVIDNVLNALYQAYISLLQALMLADEAIVQERLLYPEKIKLCRDYLNTASGNMAPSSITKP
jgi:hypothetical protein